MIALARRVRSVLDKYLGAIDGGDVSALLSLYADDSKLTFASAATEQSVAGIAAIEELLKSVFYDDATSLALDFGDYTLDAQPAADGVFCFLAAAHVNALL